jgi:hypothetical protein
MNNYYYTRRALGLDDDQVWRFHRKALIKSLLISLAISVVCTLAPFVILYIVNN